MRYSRTTGLVRAALAAALIGASALVTVPIGPVPVTLQILAVAVTVLVLSPRESLAALVTYVGLGAIGLPVFSGGSGGFGVLVGPTGGFLLGFLLAAPLGSFVRTRLADRYPFAADIAGLIALIAVSYAAGLTQFVAVTGMTVAEAFAVAVAPFLVPDAIKATAAVAIARAVRRAGLGASESAGSR